MNVLLIEANLSDGVLKDYKYIYKLIYTKVVSS